MTKDELIAIALDRKLVRTKTEARALKVDALRALVEADAASTGYEHVVEDRNALLERDAEDARAERDLREGRDLEEAALVLADQIRSGELKLGDYVEHPAKFDTLVIPPSENPQDVFQPVLVNVQCENQLPWPKEPAAPAPAPAPVPMNRRARRRAAAISRLKERARARAERLGL